MKLDNHVAYKFITGDKGLMDSLLSKMQNIPSEIVLAGQSIKISDLMSTQGNKSFYVTDSVMNQLDLLKIKRHKDASGKEFYDWGVFKSVSNRKVTLVFPDNTLLRLVFMNGAVFMCRGIVDDIIKWKLYRDALWDLRSFDTTIEVEDPDSDNNGFTREEYEKTRPSDNEKYSLSNEETFIYKVLCFMYLTENDELVIKPGEKHGTKKSGKVVNSLPVPITVVTSRWNTTSIRTEGFDVSGHFRVLQSKVVFIQPFRKHGYIRKAKSIDEK